MPLPLYAHLRMPFTPAWSLRDVMLVHPIRFRIAAFARTCGWRPSGPGGIRVPPMSRRWLVEHEADFDKHGSTL